MNSLDDLWLQHFEWVDEETFKDKETKCLHKTTTKSTC